MILMPNGMAATRKQELLTREEIKLVTDFERWCERRGLKMDLLCEHCYEAGEHPRCRGDNSRDAQQYKIECACTERTYGTTRLVH